MGRLRSFITALRKALTRRRRERVPLLPWSEDAETRAVQRDEIDGWF
jgi:hypothetical protein